MEQRAFVADGYALLFGSNNSNAVLTFFNPIQLDNGTGYQLRQIQVTGGQGGDSTRMAGQITGASNADLMKTGSGYLNLTANNTYAGNTLIQGGTLLANNGTSSTGTGNVIVYFGAILSGAGVIAPSVGHTVTVASGASIYPGSISQTVGTTTSTIGTLTIQANTILQNGSTYLWNVNNASPASGAANSGASNSPGLQAYLAVTGGSNALLAGNITFWINELRSMTLNSSDSYSWQVASSAGTPTLGTVTFYMNQYENDDFINYLNAGGSMYLVTNDGYLYLNLSPAPEPHPLLIAFAAMAFVFVWRKRRWVVSRCSV